MIRVKKITSQKKFSYKQFLLNVFSEEPEKHSRFFEFINGLLPLGKKKMTECFAAFVDHEILASISLKPQNRKNARWHINSLCVGSCTDETICKLINHVLSKYGSEGVETFITFVNEKTPELKELFQKGCNFRGGAHLNLWQGNNSKINSSEIKSSVFSEYKKSYAPLIAQLHNQMIFPQYRHSLSIASVDFEKRFKDAIDKKVLYCETTNSVEGYFLVFTRQDKLYIELLLSEAYEEYYPEILEYCSNFIEKGAYLFVKKFHSSYKRLEETLKEYGFEECESYALLIKDYWIEAKNDKGSLATSLSINARSPA